MEYSATFVKLSGPNKGQTYKRYFGSQEELDQAVKRHSRIQMESDDLERDCQFSRLAKMKRNLSDKRAELGKFEQLLSRRSGEDQVKAEPKRLSMQEEIERLRQQLEAYSKEIRLG